MLIFQEKSSDLEFSRFFVFSILYFSGFFNVFKGKHKIISCSSKSVCKQITLHNPCAEIYITIALLLPSTWNLRFLLLFGWDFSASLAPTLGVKGLMSMLSRSDYTIVTLDFTDFTLDFTDFTPDFTDFTRFRKSAKYRVQRSHFDPCTRKCV